MKHEKENQELAHKLALMKNQIMEYQIGAGLKKRFAAVKVASQSKMMPVSVSFLSWQFLMLFSSSSWRKKATSFI